MSAALACELERQVVEAWPAAHSEELDGWLLRASGGPTHRGNSVAALAAGSRFSLQARIERMEDWYRRRGQLAMIQIGPCSQPAELDAALEQRDYHRHGESVVALASTEHVVEATRSALPARVEERASPEWLGIVAGSSRHAASKEIFHGFLERLGARCCFVTAWVADQPATVCLGISSPGRLGVYAMHTVPELRQRGAARAALQALASHALAQGYAELYLLVEAQNRAARALYAQSGFGDVYRYHYRIQHGP
jgi:ribosomal protein S18 acetylase RimI-like enzyme